MRFLKKLFLCAVMVLTLTVSFLTLGNLAGDATPEVSATVTDDEYDICVLTNTILDANGNPTGFVNTDGLIDCISKVDTD